MSQQHALPHQPRPRETARRDTAAPLRRLVALHDEAQETARLAKLLGNTPWFVGALALAALATVLWAGAPTVTLATGLWFGLTLLSAFAVFRVYRRATHSPFDLDALRRFRTDLSSTLLSAGCTWGAGAYLVGLFDNLLIVLVFSVGLAVVAELVLRRPATALFLVAPAILLPAVAATTGPLGLTGAALIVAAGAMVAAGSELAARLLAPRHPWPLLTVS